MMTPEEINSRITEWCRIDDEFAEFITNCNKVYWMYEAEKVFEQIHKAFASVPVGTRTNCIQILHDALHFESTKKIGYGTVHIFEHYFIDEEELLFIWKHISDYAITIGRVMSVSEAYGYPIGSSPKLGQPYNVYFILKEDLSTLIATKK